MSPRLAAGAVLLLDRHYNALTPYLKGETNMYGVTKNGTCVVRYVEQMGNRLLLRPHNRSFPIETVAIEDGKLAQQLPSRPSLLCGNGNSASLHFVEHTSSNRHTEHT